ncbi:TPA: hypothetical protein ACGY2Z_002927 [Listeria monocytogenes]
MEIQVYLRQLSELVETVEYLTNNYFNNEINDVYDFENKSTLDDIADLAKYDSVVMVGPNGEARSVSSNFVNDEDIDNNNSNMMNFLADLLRH